MLKLISLLLFISFNSFAKEEGVHLPHRIRVGSNLEEINGINVTTELNIYQSSLYSNHFIEYKGESDYELGIYFNNIPLQTGHAYSPSYLYDSYIGASKFFSVSKDFKIGLGTQSGTQLRPGVSNYLNFDFSTIEYQYKNLVLGIGGYFVNNALSQNGNIVGQLVDISYKIIPGVLWTEASWISGSNNISGSVINLFYRPKRNVSLYMGIQVPAKNSGNEFAGNIGFSFLLN